MSKPKAKVPCHLTAFSTRKLPTAFPVSVDFSSCPTNPSIIREGSLLLLKLMNPLWIKFSLMICKTRKLKNCCSLYILEVLSTWNDIYKSQILDKDYPSCPLGNPEEKYAHTIFRGPKSMGHMRTELNNACFP